MTAFNCGRFYRHGDRRRGNSFCKTKKKSRTKSEFRMLEADQERNFQDMRVSKSRFLLLYAFICLIWGSTWIVIQIGEDAALPPFLGAALRMMVASVVLWGWVLIRKIPMPPTTQAWRAALINGVLGSAGSYGVVYWCSQYVPSGLDAVIFGTMPLWTIVFGRLAFDRTHMSILRLFGVLLGIAGIALIFVPGMKTLDSLTLRAMCIMMLSPVVSAISLLFTKRDARHIHPVALNAISIGIGFLVLGTIALFTTDFSHVSISFTHVWTVGYLAIIGTVVSFIIYYRLLHETSAVNMAYVALVTPVIAVFLGWLFHDEALSSYTLAGAAVILLGIWLALRAPSMAVPAENASHL